MINYYIILTGLLPVQNLHRHSLPTTHEVTYNKPVNAMTAMELFREIRKAPVLTSVQYNNLV